MAKEKKTVEQRLKSTQSALRKMQKELKKVDQEKHQVLESLSSAAKETAALGRRVTATETDAVCTARLAIRYRNQRDELERQLFLAQRMLGSVTLQASSKMSDIELSSRAVHEDDADTRATLSRLANGYNQNEECQQGVSSPVAITVNCRNALPEDPKEVDES